MKLSRAIPSGIEVHDASGLRRHVKYRIPWSNDGHLYKGVDANGDHMFHCGRGVFIDETWALETGVLDEWGGRWYVIEDDRLSGACGPCRTLSSQHFNEEAAEGLAKTKRDFEAEELPESVKATYVQRGRASEMKMRNMVSWLRKELGAEEVTDE